MRYLLPAALLLFLTLSACDSTEEAEGYSLGLRLDGTDGLPVNCTVMLSNNLGDSNESFNRVVPDEAAFSRTNTALISCQKQQSEGELIMELLLEGDVIESIVTTEPFGKATIAFP